MLFQSGRAHNDQVDRLGVDPGVGERRARGLQAEIGGELAGGRVVALAIAGALPDPLVRRVDLLGEVGVGDGALGQVAAAAEDDRTRDGHDAASTFAASSRAWRTSVSLILFSSS